MGANLSVLQAVISGGHSGDWRRHRWRVVAISRNGAVLPRWHLDRRWSSIVIKLLLGHQGWGWGHGWPHEVVIVSQHGFLVGWVLAGRLDGIGPLKLMRGLAASGMKQYKAWFFLLFEKILLQEHQTAFLSLRALQLILLTFYARKLRL